ncbi:hypothetical protein V5738_11330 [Salinisphaera sp. SPP-AMP-43]|uniref:hypothetical protein n=1 Tax=Salinisphaera sp. SPP-AMP-43 TaxID=3121288 RepID=UPI003C6EA391
MRAVVLASATALDVAAARRLADYGDLDDAGVARALEQVHMQRWGRRDLPGHLRQIDALAAIVIDQGQVQQLAPAPAVDEAALLAQLFAHWPESRADAPVALVDWGGGAQSLLRARALAHEQPLPHGFEQAEACGLAEKAAPVAAGHPAPAELIEAECLQLLADWRPLADEEPGSLNALAIARGRLWLRWQYCHGAIDAEYRTMLDNQLQSLNPGAGA